MVVRMAKILACLLAGIYGVRTADQEAFDMELAERGEEVHRLMRFVKGIQTDLFFTKNMLKKYIFF